MEVGETHFGGGGGGWFFLGDVVCLSMSALSERVRLRAC